MIYSACIHNFGCLIEFVKSNMEIIALSVRNRYTIRYRYVSVHIKIIQSLQRKVSSDDSMYIVSNQQSLHLRTFPVFHHDLTKIEGTLYL